MPYYSPYGFINSTLLFFTNSCIFNLSAITLKIRLINLNELLTKLNEKKKPFRMKNILRSFDAVYREIDEYNATYRSKFLFIVWTLIVLPMVMEIYLLLFTNTNLIIRISLIYGFFLYIVPFNFIIVKVCSVNYEANRSYNIVNSIIVDYNSHTKKTGSTRLRNLTKVILYF